MQTKIKTLSVLAAIAASGALAGSAQAAVIDNDSVQLTSNKFDFGDSGFLIGVPTGSGNLAWDYSGGAFGVSPHVTGTLHLDNANGLCGRMRLEQFDDAGVALNTTVGGTVCVTDNAHHAFTVNLNAAGDPLTDHVLVSIERSSLAAGVWTTAAAVSVTADTEDDSVRIAPGGGAGFGGSGWLFGAPIGSGTLSWNLEDGTLKPHLTGTLHLDNSAGQCARMKLNYLSESGAFITSRTGGTVCAPDNALNSWTVDLDPYRGVLGQVEVEIQRNSVAGWITIGSQTVSVAV